MFEHDGKVALAVSEFKILGGTDAYETMQLG
jgi:hypothetical protein